MTFIGGKDINEYDHQNIYPRPGLPYIANLNYGFILIDKEDPARVYIRASNDLYEAPILDILAEVQQFCEKSEEVSLAIEQDGDEAWCYLTGWQPATDAQKEAIAIYITAVNDKNILDKNSKIEAAIKLLATEGYSINA